MNNNDVIVPSAVRSAIGSFGGGLSQLEPSELAGQVMKSSTERSADPELIRYVTSGLG